MTNTSLSDFFDDLNRHALRADSPVGKGWRMLCGVDGILPVYCSRGHRVDDDQNFCHRCGARLKADAKSYRELGHPEPDLPPLDEL